MRFFVFSAPTIFKVEGRDAPRYMNARLTQNFKTLHVNRGTLAAALSAQGRCQGFYAAYRVEETSFRLHCDGAEGIEILPAFRQFLVADRVSITDLSAEYKLLHLFSASAIPDVAATVLGLGSPLELPDEHSFRESGGYFLARRTRSKWAGIDVSCTAAQLQSLIDRLGACGAQQLSCDMFEFERIDAGVPSFPQEINPDVLFSECGVRSAVSFSKGCYIGQEVVEKIDAFGKTPRILRVVRFSADSPVSVGMEVRTPDGNIIGSVVSAAFSKERGLAACFVSLKNTAAAEAGSPVVCGELKAIVEEVRP